MRKVYRIWNRFRNWPMRFSVTGSCARRMSPEEKMLAGPRLFEMACRLALEGIRDQHPEATEEEVHAILTRRLALKRRLEESR